MNDDVIRNIQCDRGEVPNSLDSRLDHEVCNLLGGLGGGGNNAGKNALAPRYPFQIIERQDHPVVDDLACLLRIGVEGSNYREPMGRKLLIAKQGGAEASNTHQDSLIDAVPA